MSTRHENIESEPAGIGQPRFGSYVGLLFVVAILGILSFALIHDDAGIGYAFTKLKPGMSPTEVAAVLGVPHSETKSGARLIQTWKMPDGPIVEVTFEDGKLITKDRRNRIRSAP